MALLVALLLSACSSTRNTSPSSTQIPSEGTLWKWNEKYGYTDVYSVPDKFPNAIGGNATMMKHLHKVIRQTPCTKKDQLLMMAIIDEHGQVMDVHFKRPTHEPCEEKAVQAIKQFQFIPGELNGEKVKTVFAFPVRFN
jgi:hypothetical protein